MINIINSKTIRNSGTTQDLLNDLAQYWDKFDHIVYNTIVSTNVDELWINDKIKIHQTDGGSPRLKISHTNGRTVESSDVFFDFYLIITDYGFLVHRDLNAGGDMAVYFAVTETINQNNEKDYGILTNLSTYSQYLSIFSNNITTDTYGYDTNFNKLSSTNTVLTSISSITGDEIFEGIYLVFLAKPTDKGKVILNDKKYYIYHSLALAYE